MAQKLCSQCSIQWTGFSDKMVVMLNVLSHLRCQGLLELALHRQVMVFRKAKGNGDGHVWVPFLLPLSRVRDFVEALTKLTITKTKDAHLKLSLEIIFTYKACERVIIVNRELGVLRSKIRELCEFYCGFFNIEGNATKEEITESIENHVKKRIHDSFILQDMQLWRLKKMKSKPGEHFLELDYCDIICQRFIIQGGGPDAIAFTGHSLNYETIEKVFPFMNASAAFEILVGSKPSWKIGGAGNIHQTIRTDIGIDKPR
eukprot:Gb_06392 [translate_table: standard]